MSFKRRQYTKEFKLDALRQLQSGTPIEQISREHSVSAKLITRWEAEFAEYGEQAFNGNGRSYKDQARIAELERAVGRQTLEVMYLQRLLRRYQQTEETANPAFPPKRPDNDGKRGER